MDTDEVTETCQVYGIRTDLDVDADNDGDIDADDEPIENTLPGKVIFADKDAYWRETNLLSQAATINVNFDVGSDHGVPSNCFVLLQWYDTMQKATNETCLDLFTDAPCSNGLARTDWTATYGNTGKLGRIYGPGETVPSVLYAKASPFALKPTDPTWDKTMTVVDDTLSLICYRADTGQELVRDDVKITIANTPAVCPKGDKFWVWEEELTNPDRHAYVTNLWSAVSGGMTQEGTPQAPYAVTFFRQVRGNLTPSNYPTLGQAAILVCTHHADPAGGAVAPVAFPETDEGQSNAIAWAAELGSEWAYAMHDDVTNHCWFVRVKTSYFPGHWKSTRDANDAVLLSLACGSATSNEVAQMPSFLQSAGGAFGRGARGECSLNKIANDTYWSLRFMREWKWRTAGGVFNTFWPLDAPDVLYTGHGKVTLWPAPLKGTSVACYPKENHPTGTALVLFDTGVEYEGYPMKKVSGDAKMTVSQPQWVSCGAARCGVRWPYANDTSAGITTKLRALADRVYNGTWGGTNPPSKQLAGDGKTCPKDLDWEF